MKIRSGIIRIGLITTILFVSFVLLAPALTLTADHGAANHGAAPVIEGAAPVIGAPVTAAYAAEDTGMTTPYFKVDVQVNENNTFYITERITVDFLERSRGIIRDIPYRGEVVYMMDDEVIRRNARMNVTVINAGDDNYSVSRSGGWLSIRIGDADKFILGTHVYTIRYKIELFDDGIIEYDSVYLNVIPQGWPTSIDRASVSVTFPKDAEMSNMEFIGMVGGVTNTDVMNVTKQWPDDNGNYTVTAMSKGAIEYGAGLTFRVILPEGYFINEQRYYTTEVIFWTIVVLAPIGCFLLWFFFGRDPLLVETVEFRPPEGLTPAEIGLFWDGKLQNRDLTSMYLYWAHEGRLNIEEYGSADVWLHKKRELPEDAKPFERRMFGGLFSKTASLSVKANAALINKKMEGARKDLLDEVGKGQLKTLYESRSLHLRNLALFIALLPAIANAAYAFEAHQSLDFGIGFDGGALGPILFFMIFIIRTAAAVTPRALMGKGPRKAAGASLVSPLMIVGIIVLIVCGFFIFQTPFQAIFTAIVTVVCIIFSLLMRKRTKFYNDILGRIRGFANFIKTAEADRIKMLVDEDPEYFYGILPYAWAMDLTNKWAEKFDSLGLAGRPPIWYNGYYDSPTFSYFLFVHSLNRSTGTMSSILARDQRIQQAAAGRSGGGGGGFGGFSSGGGFSGGGFGGGGGGRW